MTHIAQSDTEVTVTRKAKPKAKVASSKKTTSKKVQPKSTEQKATRAADIAKAHGIDPKKFRKALRAQNVRAPYDAAAIVRIEKLAKEMTKTH